LSLDSLETWVHRALAEFEEMRRRIVVGDEALTHDDYILIY
jgi:hypothetical protein